MPCRNYRFSFRAPYRWIGLLALAGLGALAHAPADAQPANGLPTVELTAGIHRIHAELANSDAARMRGLMFRSALGPNQGMLFIFESADRHCMWMRNTLLPLAVAFIGPDGTIVNVEEMQAQTDATHCAAHAVPFALEMASGWFKAHGLGAGSRIRGISAAPAH